MKRNIIDILVLSVFMFGMMGITVKGTEDSVQNFERIQMENIESQKQGADQIVFAGKNSSITQKEIDDAKVFFMANGESDSSAEQHAIETLMEFNALYAEAIANGFDVSEADVEKYVLHLREMMKEAANAEEIDRIISAYGDEDAYWEYMKIVYQKQLPAQNYVAYKEAAFREAHGLAGAPEEFEKAWEIEFDAIKKNAVDRQSYVKVK